MRPQELKNVEEKIKENEEKLYEFIKDKIIDSLCRLCQFKLHQQLILHVQYDEQKIIYEELEPIITQLMKEKTPLHYLYSLSDRFNSLFGPINTVNNYIGWQFNDLRLTPDKVSWVVINYNDFENNGFSIEFSKRVICNFIEKNKIRKKQGMGGNLYSLPIPDLLNLKEKMKWKICTLRNTQFNGLEYSDHENFIYNSFEKEYIDKIFYVLVDQIFSMIKEGNLDDIKNL